MVYYILYVISIFIISSISISISISIVMLITYIYIYIYIRKCAGQVAALGAQPAAVSAAHAPLGKEQMGSALMGSLQIS